MSMEDIASVWDIESARVEQILEEAPEEQMRWRGLSDLL